MFGTPPPAPAPVPTPLGAILPQERAQLPIVQGYVPRYTEQAFSRLTPIQQQQFIGSAAVQGLTPEDVEQQLATYTPAEKGSPLFGVGGTTDVLTPSRYYG